MASFYGILDDISIVVGAIVILYVIITFIFSRLFIPLLGFTETKIPKRIPREMEEKILEIDRKSKNKREYLKNVWRLITTKYHGKKREYIKRPRVLWWSLRRAWKHSGFLPCTMISYITRILLVRSRFFTRKEVKTITYFHGFVLHQCLRVKMEGEGWIYIDPWAEHLGHGIGKRLPYF